MTAPEKLGIKSDVSKCPGEGCERKNNCLRYLRPAGERQMYLPCKPDDCDGFQDAAEIVHITMEVE